MFAIRCRRGAERAIESLRVRPAKRASRYGRDGYAGVTNRSGGAYHGVMTEVVVPVLVGPDWPSDSGINWGIAGLTPRWVGMESWDCVAALEPGPGAYDLGAIERDRYIAGARQRQEMALLISTIGDPDPTPNHDPSVPLILGAGSVHGHRLPTGTAVSIARNLTRTDRDLGLRISRRPLEAVWTLKLESSWLMGDSGGPMPTGPEGKLSPLLIDGLGNPVAAVWTSPKLDVRWYVLPSNADWLTVIDWLVRRAFPAYAPGALRRMHLDKRANIDYRTQEEVQAWQALVDLKDKYESNKKALEKKLRDARWKAQSVRDSLLFDTSEPTYWVYHVLTKAGFKVRILLSSEPGGLLATTWDGNRCLVDVRASSENATEELKADLESHVSTWRALRPEEPLTHAALIVHHQYTLPPSGRSEHVYASTEFPFPVLSTRQLFDWWGAEDWPAIRNAVLALSP
jgi:hypothetical protein